MTICTDSSLLRAACIALTALTLAACGTNTPRPAASKPKADATAPAKPVLVETRPDADKGDPDRRFQEALALMKARQFPQAQAAFIALSRDYPTFSGPLTDLGILYAQSRQHELAIASLSRAVAANPQNAVAHNWLGTLYRENGDGLRAEQAYRRAITAKPDYAQAHLNLAILHDVVLHRPREALVAYRDYQRLAGGDDLIVAAWIRDLESRLQAPAAKTTAVAEATP
jgi:tetratricopeptide (TPR) repeat protein